MNQEVKQFFDEIAREYAAKYENTTSFCSHFYRERAMAAIRGVEIAGKRILDVGAGTGVLYDVLKTLDFPFDYLGVDISQAMLDQSRIPLDCRLQGSIFEVELPDDHFDLAFVLGVTSYLDREENTKLLHHISSKLSRNGLLIITYTNRQALDIYIREMMKCLAKYFPASLARKKVLTQKFKITAFTVKELENMAGNSFKVRRVDWLNQTFTPFNHAFPSMSLKLASFIKKYSPSNSLLSRLSSDFLVVMEKCNV